VETADGAVLADDVCASSYCERDEYEDSYLGTHTADVEEGPGVCQPMHESLCIERAAAESVVCEEVPPPRLQTI